MAALSRRENGLAFRLRSQESIAHGLRRLVQKELRVARDELRQTVPPRDEAVHEARKSIKKVRAILELLEADGGRGLAGSQKRLRLVNRTLSELRDADAMTEILAKLRRKGPRLISQQTFVRARRQLSAHKRAAMRTAERRGTWQNVDRQLRKAREGAKWWRPAHRGFGALASGIHSIHRRGREALARARKKQDAADFHEWRKQMKALWYELRLIEGCARTIRRDVDALHRAETWLGDDHNVVVLCAELSKDASICGGLIDLDRLRLVADRYQCDLRNKAIASTRRIYARRSRDFVYGVKRAWKAWRRQDMRAHARRGRATA